jgi:hypothetical protein
VVGLAKENEVYFTGKHAAGKNSPYSIDRESRIFLYINTKYDRPRTFDNCLNNKEL